jgi:hypothetical protein
VQRTPVPPTQRAIVRHYWAITAGPMKAGDEVIGVVTSPGSRGSDQEALRVAMAIERSLYETALSLEVLRDGVALLVRLLADEGEAEAAS